MARPRGDAGESLLEIMMAIVIMGICFASIVGALATAVRVSAIHRQQAYAATYLRNLAESVQSQAFVPCAATYSTAQVPVTTGYVVSTPTSTAVDGTGTVQSPCVGTSNLLQKVVLTVSPPDSRAGKATITVLKRRG